MVDESTDLGDNKNVAVLVRLFDPCEGKVVTRFLGIPTCNIGTGENLFSCINAIFEDRDIPWMNCIAYSSDNANVMVGQENSVLSRVREHNPNIFDLGCVCHLVNLCVKAGVKAIPLCVEELLTDVYTHFAHSTKRKEEFKEFQAFTDTNPMKLLRYCNTRWLSLQSCISRFLQQWPALQSYFTSHGESDTPGRVQRCRISLESREMHLYFLFLDFILPVLCEFNTLFQSGVSMIGHLHTQLHRLLRKFLAKFVLTKVIAAAVDITDVQYLVPENQHPDSLIAIGMDARTYIAEHQDDITPEVYTKFFASVRKFYEAVVKKMLLKFPFKDTVLKTLGFLNPQNKNDVDVSAIVTLAFRFHPDLPSAAIEDETLEYLTTNDSELPPCDQSVLDNFWVAMAKKTLPDGKPQFPNLSKLAFACFAIAHSNADPERVFSMLKKFHNDARNSLCQKTIHSLQ